MAGGQQADNGDEGIVGINVTPLVDITLVLLIIFMVVAKMVVSQSVPLDLPKAASGTDVQVVFSVELYASTTRIPYTIVGTRNGARVFTLSDELPNTFGSFRTVANPNAGQVDTVSITLTNTAASCCRNPMGLDTIVVIK